jgi:hypothetical protein
MELKKRVREYTDVSWFLKQGQKQAYLRCEDQNHPANILPIPEKVMLYIGEKKGRKTGDPEGWVAFLEVIIAGSAPGIGPHATTGTHRLVVASESTLSKLYRTLGFDFSFSQFADSVWYREFRKLYGWTEDIRSHEQQEENGRRMLGALAVLAGGIKESV